MSNLTKQIYEWGVINGVNPNGYIRINGILYRTAMEDSNGEPCEICGKPSLYNFILIVDSTGDSKNGFRCEDCW